MSRPPTLAGRPDTGGLLSEELRIVRVRARARRLFFPALILIGVAGAAGYLHGNLPAQIPAWALPVAALVVVLVFSLLPFLVWWSHVYIITTRRVIERRGVFRQRLRELEHVRGYTVQVRRGLIQRLWRTGTLTLRSDDGEVMRIKSIPRVYLVQEVLSDQVEINQILAHRDARASSPFLPG